MLPFRRVLPYDVYRSLAGFLKRIMLYILPETKLTARNVFLPVCIDTIQYSTLHDTAAPSASATVRPAESIGQPPFLSESLPVTGLALSRNTFYDDN
ncbi:MAG TPA: hypothetical protein DCW29_08710 [Janthinobacterium sp.]|nr:hypothetical protein [Janthinobacterium sp.]